VGYQCIPLGAQNFTAARFVQGKRSACVSASASKELEMSESLQLGFDYATKSDLDLARHINLALLMCDGISEQDAGFDTIIGLNDAGLSAVARIVRNIRAAPTTPVTE
jgi:hypothetical protein